MEDVKGNQEYVAKILIGVACLGWTHEFATSFLQFWTDLMMYNHNGRRFHIGYRFAYRRPVQMAQEELAQHAIDCGCTHILYIDDDILELKVENLMKLLDADKDVIGGIMFTGGFPYAMCAFRRYDTSKKVAEMPLLKGPARLYEIPPEQRVGAVECDLIPFGFTLMKTSVFSKIPKPWFTTDCVAPTDSRFCDAIMESGMKPYAHFDVWLNHKGVKRENRDLYYQIGLQDNQSSIPDQAIMITPDEAKRLEIIMSQKMIEAEKNLKNNTIKAQKFFQKEEGDGVATILQSSDFTQGVKDGK